MENHIAHAFVECCSKGDVENLSVLIKKNYKPATVLSMILKGFDNSNKEYAANHGLYQACVYNQLAVVKELFKSEELQSYLKMDRDFATYFRIACDKGFHEIVDFLLTDKSVLSKPNVNAGSPVVNKLNFTTDYAALSQFGAGTPLSLASDRSHNEVIKSLLDSKRNKQNVNSVTIEEAFINCLRRDNIDGARIIKDNSNVLKTIISDTDRPDDANNDNGKLVLEAYVALIAGKFKTVDFLANECGFVYNGQYKNHNPEMHQVLETYLLQKELNDTLDTQESTPKKRLKI